MERREVSNDTQLSIAAMGRHLSQPITYGCQRLPGGSVKGPYTSGDTISMVLAPNYSTLVLHCCRK